MEHKKIRNFLTELTILSKKYGFIVAGCGHCGSPFILHNGAIYYEDMEFDEEKWST